MYVQIYMLFPFVIFFSIAALKVNSLNKVLSRISPASSPLPPLHPPPTSTYEHSDEYLLNTNRLQTSDLPLTVVSDLPPTVV